MDRLIVGKSYFHPDFNLSLEFSHESRNYLYFCAKGNIIKISKEEQEIIRADRENKKTVTFWHSVIDSKSPPSGFHLDVITNSRIWYMSPHKEDFLRLREVPKEYKRKKICITCEEICDE
jgi:hypothetical protein